MSMDKTVIVSVQGIVQGVGFRPFVYGLAQQLALRGWVVNNARGVEIVLVGAQSTLERFIRVLHENPPPLAQVDAVHVATHGPVVGVPDFSIRQSVSGINTTLIAPDSATCPDCRDDIFSPKNRRFLYPFTNCTNCGPRLTIIRQMPYDRPRTSMAEFVMCKACEEEYRNPADRRFHAQPNGCPDCGPTLSWLGSAGEEISRENNECLSLCASALGQGKIVAIKGLGGFHLVADGCSDAAVERLRKRKKRYGKPLALMAASIRRAQEVGEFSEKEERLIASVMAPIMLVFKRPESRLSKHISPGVGEIGIMLPYTPLHYLLFTMPDCPEYLVMTSGNLTGEPLCITTTDSLARLGGVADYFLIHNRDIVTRVDDSVARVVRGRQQLIRRSRGYVPGSVMVAGVAADILACGAELKNCFAISRQDEVFLSQHIGDLKSPANLDFFRESLRSFQDLLDISPRLVVCDLHPDYLSSRYACQCGLPCRQVQHHHAHGAAIMAEHGLAGGLAVIFDGAGLGTDNTVWGGEFLALRCSSFKRLAHLLPFQLPGGDQATRQIWRIGLALVRAAGISLAELPSCLHGLLEIPEQSRFLIGQMLENEVNSPRCSSIGRLFDGVASLLGIRQEVEFEGQAAMELEYLAAQCLREVEKSQYKTGRYRATVLQEEQGLFMDFRPLIYWLLEDLAAGRPVAELAACFHLWLVRTAGEMVVRLLTSDLGYTKDMKTVLLGGGCFQNRLLLELLGQYLEQSGYDVYTGEQVPVNDGGIALGQMYVAGRDQSRT